MAADQDDRSEVEDDAEKQGGGTNVEEATDENKDETSEQSGGEEDPEFGKKADEPANDMQMKYLNALAEDQDEELSDDMSEADAANKIDELQEEAASV